MANAKIVLAYLENFVLGIFGLTVMDIMAFMDIDFLSSIDVALKNIFVILGVIYYLLRLPFKYYELKAKKRADKLANDIKEQDLIEKKNNVKRKKK